MSRWLVEPYSPPAWTEGQEGQRPLGREAVGEERAVSTFQASLSHLSLLPVLSQMSQAATSSYSAPVPVWTFNLGS